MERYTRSLGSRRGAKGSRGRIARQPKHYLTLERLERRDLLTVLMWIGGDGSFDEASNWQEVGGSLHQVPGLGDTALFSGGTQTVQFTNGLSIGELKVTDGAKLSLAAAGTSTALFKAGNASVDSGELVIHGTNSRFEVTTDLVMSGAAQLSARDGTRVFVGRTFDLGSSGGVEAATGGVFVGVTAAQYATQLLAPAVLAGQFSGLAYIAARDIDLNIRSNPVAINQSSGVFSTTSLQARYLPGARVDYSVLGEIENPLDLSGGFFFQDFLDDATLFYDIETGKLKLTVPMGFEDGFSASGVPVTFSAVGQLVAYADIGLPGQALDFTTLNNQFSFVIDANATFLTFSGLASFGGSFEFALAEQSENSLVSHFSGALVANFVSRTQTQPATIQFLEASLIQGVDQEVPVLPGPVNSQTVGVLVLPQGTLMGSGGIVGDLTNEGLVRLKAPTNDPLSGFGLLVETYTQTAFGTLHIDIASDYRAENIPPGVLTSLGAMHLENRLRLNLTGDFSQRTDPIVAVISPAVPISGGFTVVEGNRAGSTYFAAIAGSNTVEVQPQQAGIDIETSPNFFTDEAGKTATFTVKLKAPPTTPVTVQIGTSDSSEGVATNTTGGNTLLFTVDNWDQLQTVIVRGVDDLLADGDISYFVNLHVVSDDPAYAGLADVRPPLVNQDNETGQEKQAKILLKVTDALGNVLPEVSVGQTFYLEMWVDDLRGEVLGGVLAAYADVVFNSARASVSGPAVFSSNYSLDQSLLTGTAGLLDELGARTTDELGGDERRLVRVPMVATSEGTLGFTANAAGGAGHGVRLSQLNDALPPNLVDFGSTTVNVVLPLVSAGPFVSYVATDLGNGLTAYDVFLDDPNNQQLSYFADSFQFNGAINQVSGPGSIPVNDNQAATSLNGVGGYSKLTDSYFFTPWTDNTFGPGVVQTATTYAITAGTGGGSQHDIVQLAHIVAAGNVTFSGVVSRNAQSTSVSGTLVAPNGTATAISIGQVVTGAIDTPGSSKQYQFTAVAGQTIYFDRQLLGDGTIDFTIQDPNGATVTTASGRFYPYDAGPVTLSLTGTYTLIADGRDDSVGNYSFQIWDVPATTTTAISIGDVVSDALTVPGAVKQYQFTAVAGQTIYFDRQLLGDGTIDFTIQDPNGATVTTASGRFYPYDAGPVTLSLTGTYTLIADGRDDSVGNYSFQIWDVNTPPGPITLGSLISGNIAAAGATQQWDLVNSSPTLLSFAALQGTGNLHWKLVAPSGATLLDASLSSSPTQVQASELGTYHLIVSGNGDNTGEYLISAEGVSTQTTFTWIGGDGNFNDPAHWIGGAPNEVPELGDMAIFGAGNHTVTIGSGQQVDALQLLSGATVTFVGTGLLKAGQTTLNASNLRVQGDTTRFESTTTMTLAGASSLVASSGGVVLVGQTLDLGAAGNVDTTDGGIFVGVTAEEAFNELLAPGLLAAKLGDLIYITARDIDVAWRSVPVPIDQTTGTFSTDGIESSWVEGARVDVLFLTTRTTINLLPEFFPATGLEDGKLSYDVNTGKLRFEVPVPFVGTAYPFWPDTSLRIRYDGPGQLVAYADVGLPGQALDFTTLENQFDFIVDPQETFLDFTITGTAPAPFGNFTAEAQAPGSLRASFGGKLVAKFTSRNGSDPATIQFLDTSVIEGVDHATPFLPGPLLQESGLQVLPDGKLTGRGTISGNVNNEGLIQLQALTGATTGAALTVTGNYVQSSFGTLQVDATPNYSTVAVALAVTGAANIENLLRLNLSGEFGNVTQPLSVIASPNRTGGFTSFEGNRSGTTYFSLDSSLPNLVDVVPQQVGLVVETTPDFFTDEAGKTATFGVKLRSAPTAPVTVQIGTSDSSEGVATNTTGGSTLVFTVDNWNQQQTVIVTGINDLEADGDISYFVNLHVVSEDLAYAGLADVRPPLVNQDNETGQEKQAKILLKVTDAAGNVLPEVSVGQTFYLEMWVDDLRGEVLGGVLAAYADVVFNAARASVSGPAIFSSNYSLDQSLLTATTGLLDELGAATSTNLGGDARLLVRVPFVATSEGTLGFTANAAGGATHGVRLTQLPGSLPPNLVDFGNTTVEVVDASTTTPTVTLHDAAPTSEGNDGQTTNVNFQVELSRLPTTPITINYRVFAAPGDKATAGVDFVVESGSITFTPEEGLRTKNIVAHVKGDLLPEFNKSFHVEIMSTVGDATVVRSLAVASIVDDDADDTLPDEKAPKIEFDDDFAEVEGEVTGGVGGSGGSGELIDLLLTEDGAAGLPGDWDFTRFELERPTVVRIEVVAQRLPTPSSLDAVLALVRRDGLNADKLQIVATSDDTIGRDPVIEIELPAGVYFAGVGGAQGTRGTYRLLIELDRPPVIDHMSPGNSIVTSPNLLTLFLNEVDVNPDTVLTQAFQLLEEDPGTLALTALENVLGDPQYLLDLHRILVPISAPLPSGKYFLRVAEMILSEDGTPLRGAPNLADGVAFLGSFVVDAVAPVLLANSLRVGGASSTAASLLYRLVGEVNDEAPATAGEQLRVELDIDGDGKFDDGTAALPLEADGSTSFSVASITALPVGGGEREVAVRFIDARGNVSAPFAITIDTNLPIVTDVRADDTKSEVSVSFSRDDLKNIDQAANYAISGRSIVAVAVATDRRTVTLTLDDLPDGVYTLTVETGAGKIFVPGETPIDLDGNFDGTPGDDFTGNFTVDRTAPTITNVALQGSLGADNRTNDLQPTLLVTVRDVFPGLPADSPLTLSIDLDGNGAFDDGTLAFTPGATNQPKVVAIQINRPLVDGNYIAKLRLVDAAGNVAPAVADVAFAVDRLGPKILSTQVSIDRNSSGIPTGVVIVTLDFDEALDEAAAEDLLTYRLLSSGGDGNLYDVDPATDHTDAITSRAYLGVQPGGTWQVTVTFNLAGRPDDVYQLIVDGKRLIDLAGNRLVGGDYRVGSQFFDEAREESITWGAQAPARVVSAVFASSSINNSSPLNDLIVLAFTGPDLVETQVESLGYYELVRLDAPAGPVGLAAVSYDALTNRAIIRLSTPAATGRYQLTIRKGVGESPPITSLAGSPLLGPGGVLEPGGIVLDVTEAAFATFKSLLDDRFLSLAEYVDQATLDAANSRKTVSDRDFATRLLQELQLVSNPNESPAVVAARINERLAALIEGHLLGIDADNFADQGEFVVVWAREARFLVGDPATTNVAGNNRRVGRNANDLLIQEIPGATLVQLETADGPLMLVILPIDPRAGLIGNGRVLNNAGVPYLPNFNLNLELADFSGSPQAGYLLVHNGEVNRQVVFTDQPTQPGELPFQSQTINLAPAINGIDPNIESINKHVQEIVESIFGPLSQLTQNLLWGWIDPVDFVMQDAAGRGTFAVNQGAVASLPANGAIQFNGATGMLLWAGAPSGNYSLGLSGVGTTFRGALNFNDGTNSFYAPLQGELGFGATLAAQIDFRTDPTSRVIDISGVAFALRAGSTLSAGLFGSALSPTIRALASAGGELGVGGVLRSLSQMASHVGRRGENPLGKILQELLQLRRRITSLPMHQWLLPAVDRLIDEWWLLNESDIVGKRRIKVAIREIERQLSGQQTTAEKPVIENAGRRRHQKSPPAATSDEAVQQNHSTQRDGLAPLPQSAPDESLSAPTSDSATIPAVPGPAGQEGPESIAAATASTAEGSSDASR